MQVGASARQILKAMGLLPLDLGNEVLLFFTS